MKYTATCPICGWSLIKAAPKSEININCPKCNSFLKIKVEENGIHIIAAEINIRAGK